MAWKTKFAGLLVLGLLAAVAQAGTVDVMMVVPKTLYTGASASATITVVNAHQSSAGIDVDLRIKTHEGGIDLAAGQTDEAGRFVARRGRRLVHPGGIRRRRRRGE